MESKELKQLRKKMTELRDAENSGSFLDGVDACIAVIDGELANIEVKEEIAALEAKLSELRRKLSTAEPQETKPKTGRRGRPPKQTAE
jgi:hypothetical protein